MAQPMMKEESVRPSLARRKPVPLGLTPQGVARAEELERQLGRPLRLDIEGPLTDAESEEILLARLMDGEFLPAEKFLEDCKHLREKRAR